MLWRFPGSQVQKSELGGFPAGAVVELIDTGADYGHANRLPTDVPFLASHDATGNFGARRIACDGLCLSIFTFSGYELSELVREEHKALLAFTDVLVAGRYRKELRVVEEPWLGSSNQTIHCLSDRYAEHVRKNSPCSELFLSPDGSITATGFPADALVDVLFKNGGV